MSGIKSTLGSMRTRTTVSMIVVIGLLIGVGFTLYSIVSSAPSQYFGAAINPDKTIEENYDLIYEKYSEKFVSESEKIIKAHKNDDTATASEASAEMEQTRDDYHAEMKSVLATDLESNGFKFTDGKNSLYNYSEDLDPNSKEYKELQTIFSRYNRTNHKMLAILSTMTNKILDTDD